MELTAVEIQGPTATRQDYATPDDFIAAVVDRFGVLLVDLAASDENAKCSTYFDERADSLSQDWTKLRGNLWLNPPFRHIEPWARKCRETILRARQGRIRILMLTPASVGARWFAEHVHRTALVLALTNRITFVGETNSFNKDLMLSVYGETPGFDTWRWKDGAGT